MKSITVLGRRWFERSYGNTYCSVRVLIDGEEVVSTEPTYGYGDYYVQLAGEELVKLGAVPEEKLPLWSYCRDNGITFTYEAVDVSRERDL